MDEFCEVFTFGSNSDYGGANCQPNILEIASRDPNVSLAVRLIKAARLTSVFDCAGPFTLLLPSNQAIQNLGENAMKILLDPRSFEVLQDLLLYHILPGAFPSDALVPGFQETLFTPADVLISLNPIRINTAGVVLADVKGCNGLYHVINEVLVPGMSFLHLYHFYKFMGV